MTALTRLACLALGHFHFRHFSLSGFPTIRALALNLGTLMHRWRYSQFLNAPALDKYRIRNCSMHRQGLALK
jgi:hypothetical protein